MAAPPSHLRYTLILGALTAFGPMSVDMYLPALPTIEREFLTATGPTQLTLSAYLLGMALGQLAYGPISDMIGRKKPLYAGLLLYVLASAGCAAAGSIEQLIALRFLQAVGGSAGVVMARAMVRDLFEAREAARMFSLLMLVMGVAPILAPLAGGWMMLAAGWRAVFWVLAAFGAACLAASLAGLPETRAPELRGGAGLPDMLRGFRFVLAERRFIGPALAGAFAGAGMMGYISAIPFVLIGQFGVAPERFGWFFGLNAFGLIACSQLNRRLLARHPVASLLRFGLALNAASALTLLAVTLAGIGGVVGLMIPLFGALASLGFVYPNASALALAPFPERAGTASSVMGTMQHGSGALVGALVGASLGASAVPMALAFALCGLAANLALRVASR